MDVALIAALDGAYDEGRTGAGGISRAVKLASMLGMQKTALSMPPGMASVLGKLKPSETTRAAIVNGLVASGTLSAAGLGVRALAAGGRSLTESVSKKRDLEKILETFPRLKEYPRAEIELAYNSIRHMNPHIASDPLAGGSLLGRVLLQRDTLDPKTMRMEVDLAGNLLRLRPEDRHVGEEIVREAVSTGMAMGFQEAAKTRDRAQAEVFQGKENDKNRTMQGNQMRAQAGQAQASLNLKKQEMSNRAKEMAAQRAASERDSKTEHGRRISLARMQQTFQQDENTRSSNAQDRREGIKAMFHGAGPDMEHWAMPLRDHNGHPTVVIDPASGLPHAEGVVAARRTLTDILNQYPHLRP